MTSQFQIDRAQRLRLLAGCYDPLVFETKPYGCEPGAIYVLQWSQASSSVMPNGDVVHHRAVPEWFIVVTSVVWRSAGGWAVRFDVTDRRDQIRYLKRGAGYTSSRWLAVDERPVLGWTPQMERAAKLQAEFDAARRLARFAEERRERSRRRRMRRAA